MTSTSDSRSKRIAVIGGGVCGIAAARTLQATGHDVAVYEAADSIGGVWRTAYAGVRLQNEADQYHLADLPWPEGTDLNPTREQVLDYLRAAVDRFDLDVRCSHRLEAMEERSDAWSLTFDTDAGTLEERYDYVVLAVGQFSSARVQLRLPGAELFRGRVICDRDVQDLGELEGQNVAVVGFGKSALDIATFAAERGSQVHHVFRAPRWLIPQRMLGRLTSQTVFARVSTAMIPAWSQPTRLGRALHGPGRPFVRAFWALNQILFRAVHGMHPVWGSRQIRARMRALLPDEPIARSIRASSALAPPNYFSTVRSGRIEPHRGEISRLYADGIELSNGERIPADVVIASMGCVPTTFPYLPEHYRRLLETEPDGVQLYRHVIHPDIPRVAFAGFNQSMMTLPCTEVAMLWASAWFSGDLILPSREVMEHCIETVRSFKREHILFEPTRGCGVNMRFHQHIDVLLADLGLNSRRKATRLAELFVPYGAADYAGLIDEYLARWSPDPRFPIGLAG